MENEQAFHAGLLVFPMLTQLDLTGPYEVLNRIPGAQAYLIAETLDPVRSEHGLPIAAIRAFPLPLDRLLTPTVQEREQGDLRS